MSSAIARGEPFPTIPRYGAPLGPLPELGPMRPPLTIECRACGQDLALILDDWGYWRYSHPWSSTGCPGRQP